MWWIRRAGPLEQRRAQDLGLAVLRRLNRMERPLPLEEEVTVPDSFEVRPFDPERDSADWLRVNNAAFAWHPEQGNWSSADLERRLAEPWVDLDGFLVHEGADGRLDGFCWTKVHRPRGEEPVGEIFVIAAAPESQGSGLGRSLVIAGLNHLWRRHATPRGMLYVESDNTRAVRTYEHLGFTTVSTDLGVELPPGSIFDLDRAALELALSDEPAYRVEQLWSGLYRDLADLDDITTLPRELRTRLGTTHRRALEPASRSMDATGDTVKYLWRLRDGASVETVLMVYPERATVCVSTQAGCAMACSFCATGQGGFERHLSIGEIVEQVIAAARDARPRRVSNVVFMGMGEPLANYEATWAAIRRLNTDVGISARHLTVSTVGLVPGIRRMATEDLPVNLAVSLHAANDALRDRLVPINRRYPIDALVDACEEYLAAHNRRLSLEWAMIDGVNDGDTDATELAGIARRLRAHVNLIPLNRTAGYSTPGSTPERVREFAALLVELGVNATVRANRGTEIDAACGQLRARVDRLGRH